MKHHHHLGHEHNEGLGNEAYSFEGQIVLDHCVFVYVIPYLVIPEVYIENLLMVDDFWPFL